MYEKINVLRFRYLYYSDDQDGYSAVFKWLYEHSNDGDRGVFDVVQYGTDYYNDFTWFKTHNKLYENNFYVNNHDTLNVRKFDWMTDYDRTKANDVLRKVIKSVIMTHPLQVIELTLFIKPFQFLHIYLNHYIINYIVYLTLFPSIVAISILLYSTIIVKKLSSNELNSLYGLVLIIFLFSSITMFFTYPAFKMVDQALLFSMCINCVIIGTLSKYSGKVKKILVHISRKFLRISFLENIKKNMRIFHSS